MRRLVLALILLVGCDRPESTGLRSLELGPGCAYDLHHDGVTGCAQDAALCYDDLAAWCVFDPEGCHQWASWCADEAQRCIKEATGEG